MANTISDILFILRNFAGESVIRKPEKYVEILLGYWMAILVVLCECMSYGPKSDLDARIDFPIEKHQRNFKRIIVDKMLANYRL